MFLPKPSGLSLVGRACGYNSIDPLREGTLSTNTQGISTMFGWRGRGFVLLKNLWKEKKRHLES